MSATELRHAVRAELETELHKAIRERDAAEAALRSLVAHIPKPSSRWPGSFVDAVTEVRRVLAAADRRAE